MNAVVEPATAVIKESSGAKEETKAAAEISGTNQLADEAKGFALTIKESFVDSILEICEHIRPNSFLQATNAVSADDRPFVCQGDPDQLLLIADESALMTALDSKQILSWPDFEYVLCLVIENRILRLYQANLEK